jgi:hypothetical protein
MDPMKKSNVSRQKKFMVEVAGFRVSLLFCHLRERERERVWRWRSISGPCFALYQNSEVFITGMIVLHGEMKGFSKSG